MRTIALVLIAIGLGDMLIIGWWSHHDGIIINLTIGSVIREQFGVTPFVFWAPAEALLQELLALPPSIVCFTIGGAILAWRKVCARTQEAVVERYVRHECERQMLRPLPPAGL